MLSVAKAPSQFCMLTDLKLLIRKHSGFLLSLSSVTKINITLTMNHSQHQHPSQRCLFNYVADLEYIQEIWKFYQTPDNH